jgi:predicted transcriptional regulator
MPEETTTIRITFDTKAKLDDIGKKSDTYDDIIKRLLELASLMNKD